VPATVTVIMFSAEREDKLTRSPPNVDDVKARLSFRYELTIV